MRDAREQSGEGTECAGSSGAGSAPRPGSAAEAERRRAAGARNPLEWAVAGISAALILATIGFLVYDGLTPDRPPLFEIHAGTVRRGGELFHLPLGIRNRGDRSVQNVQIRIDLVRGRDVVARSEATLEWLPGGSQRRVTAVFREDPRAYRVVASVRAYHEP